jgi:hypothetical protein
MGDSVSLTLRGAQMRLLYMEDDCGQGFGETAELCGGSGQRPEREYLHMWTQFEKINFVP